MNNSDILMRIANGCFEGAPHEREACVAGAAALKVDHMEVAYLSMGALQALDKDGGKAYDFLNPHASLGQDGMIQEVLTKCLPAIQTVWAEVKDGWDGVFLYDVVEPLGMWFINEWVRTETPPTEKAALAMARKWADE